MQFLSNSVIVDSKMPKYSSICTKSLWVYNDRDRKYKADGGVTAAFVLYVDDGVLAGEPSCVEAFKQFLEARWTLPPT